MYRSHAKLALVTLSMFSGQVLAHTDSVVHIHHEYIVSAVLVALTTVIVHAKQRKASIRKAKADK